MRSRTFFMLTLCAVLLGALLPQPAAQARPAAATLVAKTAAPNSEGTKFPDVAGFNDQVYLVSTPGNYQSGGTSTVWQKRDASKDIPAGTGLGSADGQADYRSSTVAVGADGTAYVAWTDAKSGKVSLKRKPVGGSWSDRKNVSSANFPTNPTMTVASDGTVFVAWNASSRAQYRFSKNGGDSWSGTATVGNLEPFGARQSIGLASGPDNRVAIVVGLAGKGGIRAGLWNGSSFDISSVAGDNAYNPTVTIAGDGRIYAAWRNVNGGVYYSERQANGSWPNSKLASTNVNGTVAIDSDKAGNLHAAWSDAGSRDVFYTFRPAGGDWQTPDRVEYDTLTANVLIATTLSSAAFGHVVHEDFRGNGSVTAYELFSSPVKDAIDAAPEIDGGAQFANKSTLTVTFKDVAGDPTEARARFGTPPTEADAWKPITNGAITVDVPATAGVAACTPLVLYTQVRNAAGTVQATPKAAQITVDRAVQASIIAGNPNVANLATTYTPLGTKDSAVENGGASNGDPKYTRVRQFFLGINNSGDCSGLKDFSVDGFSAAVPTGGFANAVPLPGDPLPGPRDVAVTVTDNAGNTRTVNTKIIYDPGDTDPSPTVNNIDGLPVLSVGGTAKSDGSNSVLQTLTLSNISVSDNLYDVDSDPQNGNSYWGLWIAVSRTDVGPEDANLNWYPVQVQNPGPELSVTWSLFSGLNYGAATDKTGDYYVYVRVLDGAGNPSVSALKVKATLQSGYKLPSLYLPLATR